MKLSMWAINSDRPAKEAPLSDRPARIENQTSIWLSQEPWVGRIVEMHVPMACQPLIAPRLVGGQIVEDDVKLAVGICRHDAVHEVEKLDAPAPPIVAAATLPVATSRAANNVVVPCRL